MKLLLVHEVAAVARVPESTVRYWATLDPDDGGLPSIKVGRHRRIRVDVLAKFLGLDGEHDVLEALKAAPPRVVKPVAPKRAVAAR